MKMSPTIGALAEALAKAQGMMKAAEKDGDNPFFKSSYSTLATVIEAIRVPFSANKLSFSQPTSIGPDGSLIVETMIMHASGEWLCGEITGRPVKNDPQGIGSLQSYLKRYGLQAMAGVASRDDDDDGNAASGKAVNAKAPPPKAIDTRPTPKTIKDELLEIPFGSYPTAVYTELDSQKQILAAICKKKGITHTVHLQTISKGVRGVDVNHLDAAVAEFLQDHGDQLR